MSDRVVALPHIDGFTWRPMGRGDADAVAGLLDDAFEVDGGYRVTPEEVRDDFDLPDTNPQDDTLLAVDAGGRVGAMGWCRQFGEARTEHRIFAWNVVHPDLRGRGIGAFLLRWWEVRGARRLSAVDDALPRVYRLNAYDWQTDRIALFTAKGYRPVRYFTEMLRDLADPVPTYVDPAGVDLVGWSPTRSEDARRVHNDAFADHWGSQPLDRELWEANQGSFFLEAASFLAYDGADPVAYLFSSSFPHDFADRGRTESWIEGIGTVRSHRGRGIASALIVRAMGEFRDAGTEYACLGVDAENPTGALGLYERLGFCAERRSIEFSKVVPREP